MKRNGIYRLALAWITAISLLGFVPPGALRAAELPTVEVGLPNDGVFGLGGHYIIDKKLDRKNGFILKPRWAGVPEILRLMGIGALPVGLAVSEVTLRANLKGTPIRLLQPYQLPHIHVLVRKESAYNGILDLKGKSIALTSETTSLYNMFDYVMKKRGVTIEKDFELKKLGAPAIIAVLERGEVEGAIIWEAHVSRLLASGKYRAIMGMREEMEKLFNGRHVILTYIGALDSWIKENPQLIPKIRAAWAETAARVQDDEAHFRKHAKALFGLEKPDEISLGWKRTRTALLPKDYAWPSADNLAVQKKYLTEATELGIFPSEAKSVIDPMFVP